MTEPEFKEISDFETIINFTENLPGGVVTSHPTTKVQAIINNLICRILEVKKLTNLEETYCQARKQWIEEGVNCERLNPGDPQWKKGKVRVKVSVEFLPDEPLQAESPLDEIRREMQQDGES